MKGLRALKNASCLRLYTYEELWGHGKPMPLEEWAVYVRLRLLVAACPWRPWLRLNREHGLSDRAIASQMRVPLELWQKTKKKLEESKRIMVWKDNMIYVYFFKKAFDVNFLPSYYGGNVLHEKRTDDFKVRESIIEHLNKVTGKHYTTEAVSTLRFIDYLLRVGYGVDDFKKVIDRWWDMCKESPELAHLYMKPRALFTKPNFFRTLMGIQKGAT